ncbi:MAG: AAA family ATPase [Pseudomonadota bacterium]|uniref:bifunctional aminoglycoside phosphotransferase/ATP-binding protein n=2 Tax=Roseovarius TaxID=74030 RepID=UPI0022A84F6F|nr:bifunctional aminoglycoside phosphotransferase/ATP-binding protein [Roseovarius sp. EGI FJ00037]MCZ0813090.1 AAA family ATPase [Roseovarius sp. EGI FJ00037]
MRQDDQGMAKAFLSDSRSYGMTSVVERIDTHISHLFLAGERVFKLKRAVCLPYLDFSTPELRLAACETELRLNRRTAPELYLGVRRITAGARRPEFDGSGGLLDAVVEMRRFDQDALFDSMAQRGALTSRHLDELAHEIMVFHATTPVDDDAGGADNIASVLRVNAESFRQGTVFAEADISRLDAAFETALRTHADRLNQRARVGHVRRCHGDLHLRNICLYEGRVRLFDCLEFNDALATVDVLYDLAFLTMDLWHRGLRREASQVVNRYCDASGQEDGYVLMPFFMALRAAVRTHVIAKQSETAEREQDRLAQEARAYFDLAEHLLEPAPARLLALGGLSGSGKSTIAAALAPHLGHAPGARVISSDRTRKAMFDTASDQPLPPEAYSAEVSARVYSAIAARSKRLLEDGVTVIVEAVHDRAEDRARIEAVAAAAGAPFDGFWLQADPEALNARLKTRDPGASDADADVLANQLARAPKVTDWQAVSTIGTVTDSLNRILAIVTGASDRPSRRH